MTTHNTNDTFLPADVCKDDSLGNDYVMYSDYTDLINEILSQSSPEDFENVNGFNVTEITQYNTDTNTDPVEDTEPKSEDTAENAVEDTANNAAEEFTRPLPNSKDSAFIFYDIESLNNIFTVCTYHNRTHEVNLFILNNASGITAPTGNDIISTAYDRNNAWVNRARAAGLNNPDCFIWDLATTRGRDKLAATLGGITTVNNPHIPADDPKNGDQYTLKIPAELYPICDTALEEFSTTTTTWDPKKHPFIVGYNSFNYDTVMLALYFAYAFDTEEFPNLNAHALRYHNDKLFSSTYKDYMPGYLAPYSDGGNEVPEANAIRSNMLSSGRHVDIARLNETQKKVALKRLLGLSGHQILESDRLSGSNARVSNTQDIIDLLAYNVSDVIGTAMLFDDPVYAGAFDLRAGLMHTYPEVIWNHTGDFATPEISPYTVRGTSAMRGDNRLHYDDSSAKFTAHILAPYRAIDEVPGHQADRMGVSFLYPDPKVAEKLGTTPTNVLEDARDFMHATIPANTESGRKALEQFENVYQFYRSIEGKNFNDHNVGVNNIPQDITDFYEKLKEKLEKLTTILNDTDPSSFINRITHFQQALQAYFAVTPHNKSKPNPGSIHLLLGDLANIVYFPHSPIAEENTLIYNLAQIIKDYMEYMPDKYDPNKDKCYDELKKIHALADWLVINAHLNGLTQDQINKDIQAHTITWPPVQPLGSDGSASQGYVNVLKEIQQRDTNIPYYYVAEDNEVLDTGCFATFSTGGLHGAEYNKTLYDYDKDKVSKSRTVLEHIIAQALEDKNNPLNTLHRNRHARFLAGEVKTDSKPTKKMRTDIEQGAQDHKFTDYYEYVFQCLNGTTDAEDEKELKKEAKLAKSFTELENLGLCHPGTDTPFSTNELIVASYWIRLIGSIDTYDDNGDLDTIYKHSDLLVAGLDKDKPMLRTQLKDVKDVDLFRASKTTMASHNGQPHEGTILNSDYVTTSVGTVIHEDFSSYYPLMLTNLAAFDNPDLAHTGTADRYSVLFNQKEEFGRKMKDKENYTDEERAYFKVQREGVKLILNSASGAADAGHKNNIRMNNTIISMRLIGQILTWRIGQEQSLKGGRIVSTNTDGLYSDLEWNKNQEVLDRLAPIINVKIEPEELTLVSKDSNNRVEFDKVDPDNPLDTPVLSASGGSLSAANGPSVRKALAHPAIYDRILSDYFKLIAAGNYYPDGSDTPLKITDPMNEDVVKMLLERMEDEESPAKALQYYQNLISSSPRSHTYLYATSALDDATDISTSMDDYKLLQHYNRAFMVDADKLDPTSDLTPVRIGAAKAKVVNAKALKLREEKSNTGVAHNRYDAPAVHLLTSSDEDVTQLQAGHDIGLYKHTGIDPVQDHIIVNTSLYDPDNEETLKKLLSAIDKQAYIDGIVSSYTKNWKVTTP